MMNAIIFLFCTFFFSCLFSAPLNEKTLEDAVVRNMHDYESWYNLGVIAHKKKNFNKSTYCFEQALEQGLSKMTKNQKKIAYYNVGNASARAEQYDKALEYFEKILEFDPENEKVHKKIELIKMLQKQREQEEQEQPQEQKDSHQESLKEQSEDSEKKQEKNQQEATEQNTEDKTDDPSNTREQKTDQGKESRNNKSNTTQEQVQQNNEPQQTNNHMSHASEMNDNERIQDIIDSAKEQESSEGLSEQEQKLKSYLEKVDDNAQKQLLARNLAAQKGTYRDKLW